MKLFLSIFFLCVGLQSAWAQPLTKTDVSFKKIPIWHEGRFKPLDTFARSLLTQFSGKDHYQRMQATVWLATLIFDPDATLNDKIFQINNPDTATALGIEPDNHRRYTPAQLQKVYRKLAQLRAQAERIPEKERSLVDNEIIRVFANVNLYADLSRSFLFTYPHDDFKIDSSANKVKLGFPAGQKGFSFIDIALKARTLSEMTHVLEGKSSSSYTSDDVEILRAVSNMLRWSEHYKDMPLMMIPSKLKGWVSPWDAFGPEFALESTQALMLRWHQMAVAFRSNDQKVFDAASAQYLKLVAPLLSKQETKAFNRFDLELFYHAASPFTAAIILYILTFICFIVSFTSSKPFWYRLAMLSIFAGFAVHVAGLIMRIIIMSRPPVSTLYETFVFVGFVAVLLGLVIEHYNRRWLGFLTAAISGVVMLFIANKYSADGDTLKMLVAVLNSNFWLATHVTTITMGYGATCVGGVLGHIWLIQAVFSKDQQTLDQTYKTTLGILGVALTLTFLGTNLGGIWADQSWGRFWGWDPKENGALMIVLWTALMFHAKIAKMIGPLGFAVCSVIGMMVVVWAWFGVNLLSVGLHSYGFTSGLAVNLMIYAALETLFLLVFTWIIIRRSMSPQRPQP